MQMINQVNKANPELFQQFIHGSKIIHKTINSNQVLIFCPLQCTIHDLHLKIVCFIQYVYISIYICYI